MVSFEQNDVDALPVADSVSRHEFLVIMEAPRENFFQQSAITSSTRSDPGSHRQRLPKPRTAALYTGAVAPKT